jgi:hypothetical protein
VSESRDDGKPGDSGEPQGSAPRSDGSPSKSSSQPGRGPQSSRQHSSGPRSGSARNNDPWSSATQEDAPPPVNGQARSGGQARANGQAGGRGQSGGGRGSSRGGDPVADFQRWMMKAGARSMANQVADQVKRTLGAERKTSGDVWDTATNEVPPTESPECQWCPICQAARAARTGGASGFSARLADAAGGLAGVVEGAFSVFEQAMKTQEQNKNRQAERGGPSRPGNGAASDRGETGQ